MLGIALIAGSAVAYSLAGFFTRWIPLDVMTLLFWRGVFGGALIAALIVVRHRGSAWRVVRAIGWRGVLLSVLATLASYLYLSAFRHTSVADVAIIYATLPFVTAATNWLLWREREGWRVLLASLAALGGVAVMAGGAVGAGHLAGELLAFAMTVTFALIMVLIRRWRHVSMLPAAGLNCWLTALVAWPFARTGPLAALPMVHLALFGTVQFGLGLILLVTGLRRVSSTQAALIGLLDTPLAPVWVWLAFNEVPPPATLVGGAVIMAAVVWSTIEGARRPAVVASQT